MQSKCRAHFSVRRACQIREISCRSLLFMLPRWRSRVSLDADLAEVDGNRRYFFRTDNPFPISFPVCSLPDIRPPPPPPSPPRQAAITTYRTLFKKSRETFAREFANFCDSPVAATLHGMTGRELFAWPLAKAPRHLVDPYVGYAWIAANRRDTWKKRTKYISLTRINWLPFMVLAATNRA